MGALDGRVAIITGAGRGLGREHALLFAKEGAAVIVNDLGSRPDGSGSEVAPAQEVVTEIRAAGGAAAAGQSNYGAAKTGIATLTIIAQQELERYGVRANAIAPAARTRLTMSTPGASEGMMRPVEEGFDQMDPANVSPFVAYLATEDCPIKGRVFFVAGGSVHLFQPFAIVDAITKDGQWTVEELSKDAAHFADVPFNLNRPY